MKLFDVNILILFGAKNNNILTPNFIFYMLV